MRVLIVGCGYVGCALGAELNRQGHEVFGLRRSANADGSLTERGIRPLRGDITRAETLTALPGPFDWVVNVASSSGGGVPEYEQVYREGTRHLLEWLGATPPKKFIYTSSTSVYGQTDGSQVKESSATQPEAETARVLVETEKLLLEAVQSKKFPAIILRVAGIYGPERLHYLSQYLANQVKIRGRGDRNLNMIHLDDLVLVLSTVLRSGRSGEVYNVVDDEPVHEVNFFRWLSETLGKWMPPFAEPETESISKRGATNKKVLNRKLKMELGYQFRYPTFRQGYTAEIDRLDRAGLLQIDPEPR